MSLPPRSLQLICSQLVEDLDAGRWPELRAAPPTEIRAALLGVLLERCPGFSTREYRSALKSCFSRRSVRVKRSAGR